MKYELVIDDNFIKERATDVIKKCFDPGAFDHFGYDLLRAQVREVVASDSTEELIRAIAHEQLSKIIRDVVGECIKSEIRIRVKQMAKSGSLFDNVPEDVLRDVSGKLNKERGHE